MRLSLNSGNYDCDTEPELESESMEGKCAIGDRALTHARWHNSESLAGFNTQNFGSWRGSARTSDDVGAERISGNAGD
jgi:hypothetical protein